MKILYLAALATLLPFNGYGKEDPSSINYQLGQAQSANDQLTNNPNLTPEQTQNLQKQKGAAVEKIETIANASPTDANLQLKVGKGLANADEGPRAVPYAERGLTLAQASGDPKLIRQALLTGSEVYYKAGNYDLAAKRAQAVLKENPKDADAMALYMQVKGRSSNPSALHLSNEPNKTNIGAASSLAPTKGIATKPAVAMTSAASLEAQRHIAAGWSQIELDPAKALKSFSAAVAADPKSAAARLERAKALLKTGDASGALADANEALALQSNLAEAYATRADANKALGKAEAEMIADYEQAAKLDGRFSAAYNALVTKSAAATTGAQTNATAKTGSVAGSSAQGSFNMAALDSPKSWLKLALIMAVLTAVAGVIVPLVLKRRSAEEDSQSR